MYHALFGLTQAPFSIAPDPRFLYLSDRHREALAHLLYGAQGGGGLVLLTGAVGAGKTTVCRAFVEQLPKTVDLAYVFNPALSALELLATISDEFRLRVPAGASVKAYVDALNAFLLERHAAGRSCVLVIDEAQSLSSEVLEQLRLLTNLETDTRKLLQIVLIGQPELRERLAQPRMEQVAQRVIARYHLEPLDEADTAMYVRHRLAVAGLTGPLPFDEPALKRIYRLARGVPRRINLLCDRALLGAYAQQRATVGVPIVEQAAREVFGPEPAAPAPSPGRRMPVVLGLFVLAWAAAVLGWWWWHPTEATVVAQAEAVAPGASEPADAAVEAAAPSGGVTAATAPDPAPMIDAATLVTRRGWAGEDEAWRTLAPIWGDGAEAAPTGRDACDALAAQGLSCYRGKASLALIRQLDRPAWLALQLDGKRPSPVLLVGLGERDAEIRLPDGIVRVSLATLTARWTGEFGTLWRRPPGLDAGGRLSAEAPASAWVAARLRDEQAGALPEDSSTTVRIQAFQRSQGLAVDGLAGPLTLMQLNRAASVEEPRLRRLS